jgi:hypothetical protein
VLANQRVKRGHAFVGWKDCYTLNDIVLCHAEW